MTISSEGGVLGQLPQPVLQALNVLPLEFGLLFDVGQIDVNNVITNSRQRHLREARFRAGFDLYQPRTMHARLSGIHGLGRPGIEDRRPLRVIDQLGRVHMTQEPGRHRVGLQFLCSQGGIHTLRHIEIAVHQCEGWHFAGTYARQVVHRVGLHVFLRKRPAQEIQDRTSFDSQLGCFPSSIATQQVELLGVQRIGQPGKHVEVVIPRNGKRLDPCLSQLVQSPFERPDGFEETVFAIDHVAGQHHGINRASQGSLDDRIPHRGTGTISCRFAGAQSSWSAAYV